MKKLLFFYIIAHQLYAEQTSEVKVTVPQMMSVTGSLVKASSSLIPDKYQGARIKVEIAADFVTHSAGVAQNALDFSTHLPFIEDQARLLAQRIQCFDKAGSPTCSTANIGCTTEEVCIAKLLEALANVLEPLMADLVGTLKLDAEGKPATKVKVDKNKKPVMKDGQPQLELQLEQGALLNLVAVLPPGKTKKEYSQRLGTYVVNMTDTIEFIRSLAYMLDPDEAKHDSKVSAAVRKSYEDEPVGVKG